MSVEFDRDSLDPRVRDAGILVNLLTASGDTLTLNEAWFSDPFGAANLGGVGGRGSDLVDLIVDFVGEAAKSPPNDDAWHPITLEDKPTGLNIVIGTSSGPKGQDVKTLSLGLFYTDNLSASPKIDGTVFILLPVLTFDGTGWSFVLGAATNPAQIVGEITTDGSFAAGGKTYSTLRITGDFVLDGSAPGFEAAFVASDGSKVDGFTTVQSLLDAGATDWINAVLALSPVMAFLDTKIGSSSTETIGSVLVALKLLNKASPYTVADLSTFLNQTPVDVAKAMLLEGLTILSTQKDALIAVGDGGFWVVKETAGGADRYGIRAMLPDVGKSVGAGAGKDKAASAAATVAKDAAGADNKPQALLQVGKWFSGEKDTASSWLKRVNPGLSDDQQPGAFVYLLDDDAGTLSLSPRIELVSVGFDYDGGNEGPLINVKGAKLGGFQPRLYLAMDIGSSKVSNVSWGGGIRLDDLALPLSGDFNKTTGDNPVASNLLASGDGTGGEAAEGKEAAVNPSFSVSASGLGSDLSVQLYGPDEAQTDRIWFPINRAFGPLNCKRIGIEWVDKDRLLSTLFDGGVSLSALDIDLIGLSVGMKVTDPADLSSYKLGLDGLDISYATPGVSITGGLLKDTSQTDIAYNGQAWVKAGPFGLGALGSYATLPEDKATSLFIFAFLDAPLGGPGFFFITGLAAGFGYNRGLKMPEIDNVSAMPLVAALANPSAIGGKDATPGQALAKMNAWVPPVRGQNFVSAGIKFTTYELVTSTALVALQFGNRLEIDLLGTATIKLPQVGPTFVYADLDLMVVIVPEEGAFKASLALGSKSYVLDPKCKLTGGFAFYSWFGSNEHAGDFVITLGGYHPAFTPPDYYPSVSRLGFNWPVTDKVTISGGAYFALVPSCAMGGGALNVVFADGGLKAWFTANADLIIYWNPFYFEAGIGISVGVSYSFKVFGAKITLSVSLGASMELYGPPTGGRVKIDWYVISFTVGFGKGKPVRVPAVNWTDFSRTLPSPGSSGGAALEAWTPVPKVVSINVAKGLQKQMSENGETVWFVRPDEFTWFTKSTVPATQAVLGSKTVTTSNSGAAATTDVSVRPMGVRTITDGSHTITVTGPDDITSFLYDLDLAPQPQAMWGKPVKLKELDPSDTLVPNCITGVRGLHPKPQATLVGPPLIDAAAAFTFIELDEGEFWLPIDPAYRPPASGGATPSAGTLDSIRSTLVSAAAARTEAFAELATLGIDAGANGDLTYLAANPLVAFTASPMIGSVA